MRDRVLIVDDEPAICRGIARELRSVFDVESADGYEAVCALLGDRPEFHGVVSDFHLYGGGNGIQVLETVRRRSPATLRILMSGDFAPQLLEEAILVGIVDAFVTKPLRPGELLDALLRPRVRR